MAGIIAALLGPQQDFSARSLQPAGRQLNRSLTYLAGNPAQGQVVGAQIALGHLNGNLKPRHRTQFDQGDVRPLEQLVADLFGQVAQGLFVLVAVDHEAQHLVAHLNQADDRLFRLFRKRQDAVNLILDILERLARICAGQQFDHHRAEAFAGRGRDLFHPVDTAHPVLNRQDDALLHLGWARSGVGHPGRDEVHRKFRKDLLLDLGTGDEAAAHDDQHDQIGGYVVARHPGKWPLVRW